MICTVTTYVYIVYVILHLSKHLCYFFAVASAENKSSRYVCFQFFNVVSPTLELFTSMFERYFIIQYVFHLPEPPFSPLKIGWLEYDPFLLGFSAYFQGAFAVSFRERFFCQGRNSNEEQKTKDAACGSRG